MELIEQLKNKLIEASYNYKHLLQQTHEEALVQNEIQVKRWQSYKSEYEELKIRLLSLRDKFSERIMVPLGKKALMRGSLVHTNEILICLGDGWFTKQSAKEAVDICQRRIQHCDETLGKLLKEGDLLRSRKSFTFENEAFGGEQTQEIVEPYDEEAEKQWKENHRQKEKEFREKLAKLKKNQNVKIETEEDLWKRLDALDLQEELEDEIDRMDEQIDDKDEIDESNDDNDDESSSESERNSDEEQKIRIENDTRKNPLKRRVSFKEDKENDRSKEVKDSDDDTVCITFNHSRTPSAVPSDSGEVKSPADIYAQYLKQKVPKSILKPSPAVKNYQPETAEPPYTKHWEEIEEPSEPYVEAFGEVVERTQQAPSAPSSERPVSRFKAARMANKR